MPAQRTCIGFRPRQPIHPNPCNYRIVDTHVGCAIIIQLLPICAPLWVPAVLPFWHLQRGVSDRRSAAREAHSNGAGGAHAMPDAQELVRFIAGGQGNGSRFLRRRLLLPRSCLRSCCCHHWGCRRTGMIPSPRHALGGTPCDAPGGKSTP